MSIFHYTFFQNALIGIFFISIACALIGTYIMTRRMVFLSGGITHACFGGLGVGYFLGFNPIACAAIFAVAGALGVDLMDRRMGVRNDSAIAVIWALGMALGTLFVFITPGYVPDLNSFLFGNILTITRADIWIFIGFTLLVALFYALMLRYIIAISFDTDFARTRALPAGILNTCMTVFTALAIVLSIKMIGIMLLMSMLTLPQMSAEIVCRRYRPMLFGAIAYSIVGCVGGLFLSALVEVPASATIVLLQILLYLLTRLANLLTRR